MSSSIVSVELSEPLLNFAAAEAQRRGTSVAEWLRDEVAERLNTRTATEKFFRLRRERAAAGSAQSLLDRIPANEPEPGDELD